MLTRIQKQKLIRQFISDSAGNGVTHISVSSKALPLAEIRELNCKEIRKESKRLEGQTVKVLALGWDELNNAVALCRDGLMRQFIIQKGDSYPC
ncbi:hypothetical protein [Neptuniibacter sp. QD37_11]|uniref:hypothetical protein n=1 Tax=Neptuniibacter sp. QD37_11 TaxID=3398209 RepID=UPI0039F5E660